MKLEVIILAAGKGTRMYSDTPKVLHPLAGRPLLGHVIVCAQALQAARVHVVYGHGGELVPRQFPKEPVNWVLQAQQLGTGHALMQAMPAVDPAATVLVLYGDVPLIRPQTLSDLLAASDGQYLALLTAEFDDPANYGRILRDATGRVVRIVEKKDANDQELKIKEINTGFLAAPATQLNRWLSRLGNQNAQGEYYLTDIIALAVADGVEVVARQPASQDEILGINSKAELAHLERTLQNQQAQALLQQGVTLRDPARFDLRGTLKVGRDVVIDVNVILEGEVVLGDRVQIGPNNVIRDTTIAAGTIVQPNCVIEQAIIGEECRIGPFARIRPETELGAHAHIGNFVEIKKSQVGEGSKINHLSYVGDSSIGKQVNIGAGTITCNYDGANKHRTIIGDHVFVGSDTQLVAPVTVGEGATIGAGSTITQDVPAANLAVSRNKQRHVEGWKRPTKKLKT